MSCVCTYFCDNPECQSSTDAPDDWFKVTIAVDGSGYDHDDLFRWDIACSDKCVQAVIAAKAKRLPPMPARRKAGAR